MIRIYPLCSSSKGNSTYIGTKNSGVLIDMGCSYGFLRKSLALSGLDVSAIEAVLVTHEHIDHVKGLIMLSKYTQIPIYAHEAVLGYLVRKNQVSSGANLHTLDELDGLTARAFAQIKCFDTMHDSEASCGYLLEGGGQRIGYCTDLGIVTEEVERSLSGCDAVMLEANYEQDLLMQNHNYPYYLKKRIASERGHLSNHDSAAFAARLAVSGTRRLILAHLSQENNTPELAYSRVSGALSAAGVRVGSDCTLDVAPVKTEGELIVI